MDPMQILSQVLPRARSEEELIALAAELGDPPPLATRPGAAAPMASPSGARLQGMPMTPLMGPMQQPAVPPITQGESRTQPHLGNILLGG